MSGQDDKFGTMHVAEIKYGAFVKLLTENAVDVETLPEPLQRAMYAFASCGNISNSCAFERVLCNYRAEIQLPENAKTELEWLVNSDDENELRRGYTP